MFRVAALISITKTSRTILLMTPKKIMLRKLIILKDVEVLNVQTEIRQVPNIR